ncbi:sulfite exporter TauE/SafE family protein [Shinella zoogloeoides]|uniref:sulfite exporter TauE/SafE family protein n=1 Tax=Shinella zoogloeoides TaxID=352475 RepID=UPI0028A8274D|nr:sulfite exporter TauE/SafE family protein [Shinella zoogloeoides]
MGHSIGLLTIAAIACFFVGLSKGGLPSVGTLAVPILAMAIPPVSAAALLLPIFVASDFVGLYLYRRDYSCRNIMILIPCALFGVGIGWIFSANLSSLFIGMLVGLVGVLFCANAWFGKRFRQTARPADVGRGLFWGVLTGLTSFVSHSGGPPFQMYVLPQRLSKMVFAGTSTILFAIVNAAKIIPYWQMRQFENFDIPLALWLAVPAIAGTVVGRSLTMMIPDGIFFRLIEITLLSLSLKLISDYLISVL